MDRIQGNPQAVDEVSIEKLQGDARDYLNASKQLTQDKNKVQHETVSKDPQTFGTRSELLNSGVNSKIHDKAGQPDGVQPIMNQ